MNKYWILNLETEYWILKYWIATENPTVLMSPLITMTKRAVKNLDLLKDLRCRKYLQLWNCFKSAISLGGEQDKFSVLEVNFTITETTDKDIYIFHAVISSWGLVISVKYIKLSKNVFFSSFLKSSDLTNLRYIKQNLSVSSEFVKTWVDCILKNYDVIK